MAGPARKPNGKQIGAIVFASFLAVAFGVVITFMIINNGEECRMPHLHHSAPDTVVEMYRGRYGAKPVYDPTRGFAQTAHAAAARHVATQKGDDEQRQPHSHPAPSMLAWRWLRMVLYDLAHDGTLAMDCTPWQDAEHVHDAELHEWFTRRVSAAEHRFKFTRQRAVEFACAQVQVVTFREWLPVMFPHARRKLGLDHACHNRTESGVLHRELVLASHYLWAWIEHETRGRDLGTHGPMFGPRWEASGAGDLEQRMKRDRAETSYTQLRWAIGGAADDDEEEGEEEEEKKNERKAGAVDLWDGLATERYDAERSALPPTLAYMLLEHLKRSRAGDPRFYAWDPRLVRRGLLTELHLSRYDQGVEFTASLDE